MRKALFVMCALLAVFTVSTARGTLASYQMDSTFTDTAWGEDRPAVANSGSGPINSELILGGRGAGLGTSQYMPTVVAGGVSGNALYFDGVANQAHANVWPTVEGTYPDGQSNGFTVDVWFNPVDASLGGSHTIAQTTSFVLTITSSSLFFLVGEYDEHPWVANEGWGMWDVQSNAWNHFVGEVINGEIVGTLTNGLTEQTAWVPLTGSIAPVEGWMSVGARSNGAGNFFNGSIDNLQVTYTPEPATMVLLGLGSLAVARRKK